METFSNDGLVLENNLMIEHTFSISSTCQILVSLLFEAKRTWDI